jgi:hypothetical protein
MNACIDVLVLYYVWLSCRFQLAFSPYVSIPLIFEISRTLFKNACIPALIFFVISVTLLVMQRCSLFLAVVLLVAALVKSGQGSSIPIHHFPFSFSFLIY